MNYEFPDPVTLGKYHALLMAVLVHTRTLEWSHQPPEQIADLMDAVHNIPDLVARWLGMDEQSVLNDLTRYEQKYCAGAPEFSRILVEGPRPDWQLRWTQPTA